MDIDLTTSVQSKPTRLRIGPYRSGKTVQLVQSVTNYCLKKPLSGAIVIVPSARYARLFQNRMAGNRSLGGLQILPFYRVCELLLRQSGGFFKLLPDSLEPAVISRVVQGQKQKGQLLSIAEIAEFVGTHRACMEVIDALERAGMSPQSVIEKIDSSASKTARCSEIAKLYQAYWNELAELGFINQKGLAFKLREKLRHASAQGKRLGLGLVAVDGFDRFSKLQLEVFAAIAQHAEEMEICFDYAPREEDAKLEYVWKEKSVSELTDEFRGAQFIQSSTPQTSSSVVEKFRALDRFCEMEEIAHRVKRLMVVDGVKSDDIVVVARGVKPYGGAIQAAFDHAGVPYFVDESIALAGLPIIQFILKILSITQKFDREEVLSALRSVFFNLRACGLNNRKVDQLDLLSLKYRLTESKEQWRLMLGCLNARSEEGLLEAEGDGPLVKNAEVDELSERTLDKFFLLLTPPTQREQASTYATWFSKLLEAILVMPNQEAEGDLFDQYEEKRALSEFLRLLSGIALEESALAGHFSRSEKLGERALTSAPAIPYELFVKKIIRLIDRANFGRPKRDANAVTICGADLVLNRTYDAVFLAGMVEGEFPRRGSERGFLTADEISQWSTFGVDIEDPRTHPAFEDALFRSLVSRARNYLCLSFPQQDMDGSELMPSFLLTEGEAEIVYKLPFYGAFSQSITEPVSPRDYLAGAFWHRGDALITNAFLQNQFKNDDRFESLFEQVELRAALGNARVKESDRNPLNGYLVESVSSGLCQVPSTPRWSASRLGDYGKCPFRYWANHVLKAKPYEEPQVKLTPLILGKAYHKALEGFYIDLKKSNRLITDLEVEKLDELAQVAAQNGITFLERRPDIHLGEFWEYEKREFAFRLKRFLRQEQRRAFDDSEDGTAFMPFMFEASFGSTGDTEVLLKANGKSCAIHGQIDRLDISIADGKPQTDVRNLQDLRAILDGRSLRLIDYKSGSTTVTGADIWAGRQLQLPLYAMAVENYLTGNAKIELGRYLSVSSGGTIGQWPPRRRKGKEEEKSEEPDWHGPMTVRIVEMVESIKRGDFSVKPSDYKVCLDCDHQKVCRVAEFETLREDSDADSD